ncbi:I78 family peptidase inhibitor [Sphingobium lactosutens]|nr:I78 family peptidase inhibitor [Sphingobium lactosutens]
MRWAMTAMMIAGLTGCAGAHGSGPRTPPPAMADGPCRDAGLDRFVGQKASGDIGAQLLAASGAKTLRWGAPSMAMTMDFRADRLTVSYDEAMTITTVRCG